MRALIIVAVFASCAAAAKPIEQSFYTIVRNLNNEIAYRDAEIRRLRTQIEAQPRCT